MTQELPAKRTPLDYPTVINAILIACDGRMSRAATKLCAAQVAIETGMTSCMNYNISGIKARAGSTKYDWQYFATHELFTEVQVAAAEHLGPGLVRRVGPKGGKIDVVIIPKHPYCCFRAFATLDAAMADHLATLAGTFPTGYAGLLTGDPDAFAHGLKAGRYYTALESEYAAGLKWRLREIAGKVPDTHLVWGDVV